MIHNIVDLMGDLEFNTSSRSSPDSPHHSISIGQVGPIFLFISDDYGSEGMFETTFEEKTSSSRSLDTLSNIGGRITHSEVPMPPRVQSEENIKADLQMRELAIDFI